MTSTRVSFAAGWEWLTGFISNETFIYVVKRLLQALLTLLLASALCFHYSTSSRRLPRYAEAESENFARTGFPNPQQFDWIALGQSSMGGGCGELLLKEILARVLCTSALYHRCCRERLTPYLAIASLILTLGDLFL